MPENGNGNGRRGFTIKIDSSMIAAIIAILSSLGIGGYVTTKPSNDSVVTVTDGVLETSATVDRIVKQHKTMMRLIRRKDQQIQELYETTDWMVGAFDKMGRKHPATWRVLRREAPDHIIFDGTDTPTRGGAEHEHGEATHVHEPEATTYGQRIVTDVGAWSPSSGDQEMYETLDSLHEDAQQAKTPALQKLRRMKR